MTQTVESTLTKKQVKSSTVAYTENGERYAIRADLRFDDECNNGHNTFSITGQIWRVADNGRRVDEAGGCIHEDIVRHFPQFAHLIKWHLCSTDGPMHYPANVLYLAGNRDCWGKLKGEAKGWDTFVQFGENPIKHKLGAKFAKFLQDAAPYDFEVLAIEHGKDAGGYDFQPKYTFGGFADKWHECPFDTEREALEFLGALQTCKPEFVRVATAWGEGKERDFEAARESAIWPNATDEELSAPREALEKALVARLPALLTEFRLAMESVGFTW